MKKLLFTTTAVLTLTFGVLMNYQPKIDANFDELGIQQELVNHGEQLDNHEDRITNTEADVKEVQEKTDIASSTERIIVREVVTPRAEQKPAPEPEPVVEEPAPKPAPKIVITSYKTIEVDELGSKDCIQTYSDGTTYQRKFTTVSYDNNFKMTKTSGVCDSSLLNLEKWDQYPGYKY